LEVALQILEMGSMLPFLVLSKFTTMLLLAASLTAAVEERLRIRRLFVTLEKFRQGGIVHICESDNQHLDHLSKLGN